MGNVWLQDGRRRTEPEEVAGKMLPVFAFSVTLPVGRRERLSVAGWPSGSKTTYFPHFFQVFKLKNISPGNPQIAETQRITQNQTFQINCVSLNFFG
jgi:hypothetical protein